MFIIFDSIILINNPKRGDIMYTKEKSNIEYIANKTRRCLEIQSNKIDIYSVINKLDIKLQKSNYVPKASFGRIKRVKNSFVLKLPANLTECQQRIYIAKEIGHLLLHLGYNIENKDVRYTRKIEFGKISLFELQEQAKFFSYAFLLPKAELKEVLEKNIISIGDTINYNFETVAKEFGLEERFVKDRIKLLESE